MLDVDRQSPPQYSSIYGSMRHVYLASLGEMYLDDYLGSEMSLILGLLFTTLSFLMTITLLNMLVAIMGQSFDRNNLVAESNKKMSQLEFCVNNWFIKPIKNEKDIVYFVAAFEISDSDSDDE